MRILLVNKFWKPVGGLERHLFHLRDLFEERGHEVVPFGMADPENVVTAHAEHFVSPVEFRGGAATRLRAVGRATFGLQTLTRLRRLLDEVPVDAAHVLHAYHQLGTSFFRLLERRGIPTVLSMHDYKLGCPNYRLYSDRTGEICTICFDHRFGFAWAPTATRCWDGSAAGGAMLTAEAVASRALRAYTRGPGAVMTVNRLQAVGARRMGIPPERIHVVPHFVELEADEPARDDEGDHVLYVGRLVPEKGVDVLLRAVSATGTPVRIIGTGRDAAALQALATSLGARATFVGAQPPGIVAAEMARARLLVVPSTWHEVWGLVVNEAWAAGLPVIGTDVGGLADLLADGRGVLVPPNDAGALGRAIVDLLADAAGRAAMTARARSYARAELSRARFVEHLQSVYAGLGLSL